MSVSILYTKNLSFFCTKKTPISRLELIIRESGAIKNDK